MPNNGQGHKGNTPPKYAGGKKKTRTVPRGTKKKRQGKANFYEFRNGGGTVRVGRHVISMLKGDVDVSTWTIEELQRGAPMHVKRPPHVIPIEVHVELVRRVTAEARHMMAAHLDYAVLKHMEIIKNIQPDSPTGPQIRAIEMLYDRIMGKPEENINVYSQDEKWKGVLLGAVVGNDEQARKLLSLPDGVEDGEIIEGEVVEEDADDRG